MRIEKPKPLKGVTITYNGKTYDKVLHVSRGYDYSSFSYLDDNGNECSMSFSGDTCNSFNITTVNESTK